MNLRHHFYLGLTFLTMVVSSYSQDPAPAEPTDPPAPAAEPAAPVRAPAAPAGTSPKAVPFVRPQSAIKGLLVQDLGGGSFIGKASQMNCTAIESGDAAAISAFAFNQTVGDDMKKALTEVVKHSTVKRGNLPRGMRVDFAFEDKYGGKDGPSAAVACALLLDSLRTGADIDAKFAVTGDLNADGSVQPVGGVPAKIRGAANRSCTYVAVPTNAERELVDSVLMEGPSALWDIQVFSIKTFDEALELASTKKSPEMEIAVAKFAEVQKVLQTQKNPTLLTNPKVQERLNAVLAASPNCLSAKILLNYGAGKLPKVLSLGGSLAQIDTITTDFVKHMRSPKPEGVQPDLLGKTVSELSKIRTKLDKRTVAFADSIKDYGDVYRAIKARPPASQSEALKARAQLDTAGSRITVEEDKIRTNKALREEMMK